MDNNKKHTHSNLLPAYIISASIIVASLIIAKPKLPFTLPPVSLASVEHQFEEQTRSQLANRTITADSGEEYVKTTLKEVNVERVMYNEKQNTYTVIYWILYSNSYSFGTSCLLDSVNYQPFSGSCRVGHLDRARIEVK